MPEFGSVVLLTTRIQILSFQEKPTHPKYIGKKITLLLIYSCLYYYEVILDQVCIQDVSYLIFKASNYVTHLQYPVLLLWPIVHSIQDLH